LNEGNFDVRKDFHNDKLILIDGIPYDEGQEEETMNAYDNVDV